MRSPGRSPVLAILMTALALFAFWMWQWQLVEVRGPGGYRRYRVNRFTGTVEPLGGKGQVLGLPEGRRRSGPVPED